MLWLNIILQNDYMLSYRFVRGWGMEVLQIFQAKFVAIYGLIMSFFVTRFYLYVYIVRMEIFIWL